MVSFLGEGRLWKEAELSEEVKPVAGTCFF
jgi:hypothetical protein